MKLLFFFVDGFGIGPDDPTVNPVAQVEWRGLRRRLAARPLAPDLPHAAEGVVARGIDACLGVDGKPRSGTGHVALMTGLNAPALIGRHEGPYPGPELRAVLRNGRTLPKAAVAAGRRVAFANAFSPVFHDRLARGKARWSGFGLTCDLAGLKIRGLADLLANDAISAWPTNALWLEQGWPAPRRTAREAGRILARLALRHDLTFYEYFAADFAGHRADRPLMLRSLTELDDLIGGIWDEFSDTDASLLIVSDHGNVEDWTASGHTLNPALFVAAGPVVEACRDVRALPDIAPAVRRFLGIKD